MTVLIAEPPSQSGQPSLWNTELLALKQGVANTCWRLLLSCLPVGPSPDGPQTPRLAGLQVARQELSMQTTQSQGGENRGVSEPGLSLQLFAATQSSCWLTVS